MDQKTTAKEKFYTGATMTRHELVLLDMVDRCRYIVSKHMKHGFSAQEVYKKMCELGIDGGHTPMQIRGFLVQFYGEPNEKVMMQ